MPQTKRTLTGVFGGLLGLVGLSAVAGILVTASVTPVFAVAGATAAQSLDLFEKLPSKLNVTQPMEPTTFYAKGVDGNPVQLARFYDQNRTPVTYDQVAPVLYDALLSSEDKNYYDHGGIDLVGTAKALVDNLGGGSTRGGSSISQQYVKNVLLQECERGVKLEDPDRDEKLNQCWLDAATNDGSDGIARKLKEMRYAIQIEKVFSKNDILIGYLNLVNFGGTTYGIEAAAQRYFGVSASALSLNQAATLAGLVQNPNSYRIDRPEGSMTIDGKPANSAEDGYAQTRIRRDYVLGRMLADGKITQEQHDATVAEPITPNIVAPTQGCAAAGPNAYFCQYVKTTLENDEFYGKTAEERYDTLLRGGLDVYTSLDMSIQQAGIDAMTEYAPPAIEGLKFGAAGTTIETSTGRILAMVQNTNFSEDASVDGQPGYSSLVYAADSAHGASNGFSVGSSYKIFTLIDWLEKGNSLRETLNGTNRIFNKLTCDGNPLYFGTQIVGNANNDRGWVGTPYEFTVKSLNSGYFAMAEKLDICDINRVADRMGVKLGNGGKVTDGDAAPFDILGSKNIAPLDMASAMGAIGNGGTRCEQHAIDRIVGPDGKDKPLPPNGCREVVKPDIAATAAYALQGVMTGGGTGSRSNPGDGTPLIGKTGSHNTDQTTMIMSSTKTATAVWVGQSEGTVDIEDFSYNGVGLNNTRHEIAPELQGAANRIYGGDKFPEPTNSLLRPTMTNLPNVVGMSQEQAQSTLRNAGFDVTVGAPVDSNLAPGVIAAQDPSGGQAARGATVTISPSNGQGSAVPDVSGRPPQKAIDDLRAAGFPNVGLGACTAGSGGGGTVTGTDPAAGTVVNRNATISLLYAKQNCP